MRIGQVQNWSPSYEIKVVTLLGLGFGLVGIDRWIIAPLFPLMMRDLGLNYGQLGALAGILGVGWGVSALLAGSISDKIGRRRVIIPSLVLFSLLAGLTGAVSGFGMLLVIRLVMGVTEGAFLPASVAATGEASKPSRRGFNQGFQLSLFALLGLGLGPIIATKLLAVVPSWRYVFAVVCIPGFVLAVLGALVIREPVKIVHEETVDANGRHHRHSGWREVLGSRNVILSVGGILSAMCCIFVIGAMMPSYLMDYLKLPASTMGMIMSAVGFGGFVGEFAVPGLSDALGRRTMAVIAFLVAIPLLYAFSRLGPNPVLLFALLFVIGFCGLGLLGLFTGPLPTEAVSAASTATAIGFVSGVGEIFGGGIAPVIGGWIAQTYGIQNVIYLAMAGLAFGLVIALFLRETAPRFAK